MSRKVRHLIPLVLVFIVAVAVVHRIGVINGGRQADVLRLDSERVARFQTVGDLEEEGLLTVMTGREIMDFYRSQLPVNPHVFAQFVNLNLEPQASYILTNNSEINRTLRNSLDGARVYRDRFGNEYDGRRYPNAYVLEFSDSPTQLRGRQLAHLHFSQGPQEHFLKIDNRRELDKFIAISPTDRKLNLILAGDLELPALAEETRARLGNIYMQTDNARAVERNDFIRSDLFLYTSAQIPGFYLEGIFRPLGRFFYRWGLLLVAAIIGYLGVIKQQQPLRWFAWGGLVLAASFLFSTHIAVLGVVLAGIFVYSWRRKYRRLIWFLLAGMLMFGFYFTPYLLRLYAPAEFFWAGLFAGGFVFLSPVYGLQRKFITAGDLVGMFFFVAGIWLFFYLPAAHYPFLFSTRAWLLILAPLLSRIILPETDLDEFLFLTSLGGWLYILTGGDAYLNLIAFIFALAVRTVQKSYLHFER